MHKQLFIPGFGPKDLNMATIGKEIRRHRLARVMTQEDLAEAVDTTCGYIGRIERGEICSPGLQTFARICAALDCCGAEILKKGGLCVGQDRSG